MGQADSLLISKSRRSGFDGFRPTIFATARAAEE
jgi:hypothetical protein